MPEPRLTRELDPWFAPYANYLYDVALANGLSPVVTSAFRSIQKQATLYDRYLRGLSDLPAAPPGRSLHNYGLAFDLVVHSGYRSDAQEALGRFWRSIGGHWYPSDPVHFEAPVSLPR